MKVLFASIRGFAVDLKSSLRVSMTTFPPAEEGRKKDNEFIQTNCRSYLLLLLLGKYHR